MSILCITCGHRPIHARGRCSSCYNRTYAADPDFARHYPPGATCQICDRPAHAQGLCQTHYMRAYRHQGDAHVVLRGGWSTSPRQSGCAIPGCTAAYYARGLCRSHYDRARRRGMREAFVR